MATVAITFNDAADGKVDITMFVEGAAAAPSPAEKLAMAMLKAAKEESAITDVIEQ